MENPAARLRAATGWTDIASYLILRPGSFTVTLRKVPRLEGRQPVSSLCLFIEPVVPESTSDLQFTFPPRRGRRTSPLSASPWGSPTKFHDVEEVGSSGKRVGAREAIWTYLGIHPPRHLRGAGLAAGPAAWVASLAQVALQRAVDPQECPVAWAPARGAAAQPGCQGQAAVAVAYGDPGQPGCAAAWGHQDGLLGSPSWNGLDHCAFVLSPGKLTHPNVGRAKKFGVNQTLRDTPIRSPLRISPKIRGFSPPLTPGSGRLGSWRSCRPGP